MGTMQSSKISSQVEEPRMPIFFSCLPMEKPGKVLLHDERGDACWLPLRLSVTSGNSDDDEDISIAGVGDEDLGAVQDVVVALIRQRWSAGPEHRCRRRARSGRKRPAIRRQHSLGRYFAFCSAVPFSIDGSAAQGGVSGNDNTGGAANLGQLLNAHDIREHIAACAAVLLRGSKCPSCPALPSFQRSPWGNAPPRRPFRQGA